VDYTANWKQVRDGRAVLGSYYQATADGAQADFTFDGSDLWLVVDSTPQVGQLQVSVDGGTPVMVSPGEPAAAAFGTQVPIARGLPSGHHQVHVTASQNSAIDGFIVQNRPAWPLSRVVGVAAIAGSLLALGLMITMGYRDKTKLPRANPHSTQ
jgi:hypothetical protein